MNLENIKLDIDKNNICTLIFDNKNNTNNIFNKSTINDLCKATDFIVENKNIKGIIILSAKKSFHHGYDLKYLYNLKSSKEIFNSLILLTTNLRKIETLGKPIVSAISGEVQLGGLELILHSHYKIADNSENTKIILKNTKYNLCPNIGGSLRLPLTIGTSQSLQLLLKDTILSSEEALKINIINEITKKEDLINQCKQYILNNLSSYQPWDKKQNSSKSMNPFLGENLGFFISQIAALHGKNGDHYPSIKTLISCIFEGLNTDINTGLKIEARHFTWLITKSKTRSMVYTLNFYKPKNCNYMNEELTSYKKSFVENYAAEGVKLLMDGVSPPMIENAGKRLGFLTSPLETADKIELQSIISQLDSNDAPCAALIRSMQKNNRKGCSTNKGFYEYKEKNKLKIWKGLTDLIPSEKKQPDIMEVEERLLFSSINNCIFNYSKLTNNIDKNKFDYIVIKDFGLPEWTGGPFTWIKQYDIKKFIKNNEKFANKLGSRFMIDNKILEKI